MTTCEAAIAAWAIVAGILMGGGLLGIVVATVAFLRSR